MTLHDFITDILDLNIDLLSEPELRDAEAAYEKWNAKSAERRRWKAGEKVLADRAVAGLFGGKALSGSTKQKVWAEKIRAEKLRGDAKSELTEAQAVMACDPNGLGKSAHFWIENRNRKPSEIGQFFETQKRLLAEARALRAAGKADEYAAKAAEYNALTAAWGFN